MSNMNRTPHISCILLNWNGWQDTVECLDTLRQCTYPRLSILVVDNGSTNDSIARIRAAHPEVRLMASEKNLGFAGGNNIGIRCALAEGAEYIWLLNNDTQPAPDALSALVAKAATDERLGAVASVCYYADAPSTVQAWAGTRVNLWCGYARNSTVPQDDSWFHALYGASMLIAGKAFEEAGLLDEGFFHYWEETELCLRFRKMGWKLAAAPDSRVLHKVGASTGKGHPMLDRYFTASGLRILRLHSTVPHLAMPVFLAGRLLSRFFRLQFSRCGSVWKGMEDYRHTLPVTPKIR